jgi:hypothetical protein
MIPSLAAAEPPETTVVASSVTHGAYIGPDVKLTSLAGSAALLAGAQAGWVVDHVFVLGGAVSTVVGDVSSPLALQPPDGPLATLSFTYGGARIAVVPASLAPLHVVVGVLAGAGRVRSSSSAADRVSDSFVVLEPDAAFEANLARPARLAIGGSYRFTGGTGIASLGPTALSGPSVFLTIKLGAF